MNVEAARQMARDKIEQLAAELERGQSDTLKAYLAAMSRMPRYSLNNLLLIAAQRPDAQQVAGFTTWKRLGRFVKQGEHGILILAPCVRRRKPGSDAATSTRDPSAGHTDGDPDEVVVGFRGAHVFDISQTTGAPPPQPACVNGDPGNYFDRLVQAKADRGIQLTYSQAIGAAHGVSTRDRIILRPDLAPAERFSTAVHELAHIRLGHHTPDDPAASAALHETEAEAVAYVVCQAIRLETNSASSDYLLTWGGNPETLAASLERIQRVASEIITAIGPDV